MSFVLLGILNSQAVGGGGEPAFDLLETAEFSTSSVTFSNLNTYTDYAHLHLEMFLQTNTRGTPRIRFNGDSSASYYRHEVTGTGSSSASAGFSGGLSEIPFAVVDPPTAVTPSAYMIDILDFANPNKKTTIRAMYDLNGIIQNKYASALYNKTDPLTSFEFFLDSNSFANSMINLYGIKESA